MQVRQVGGFYTYDKGLAVFKRWIEKIKALFSKEPERDLPPLIVKKVEANKSTRDSASEALDKMFGRK